jgi:cell division protease FtsH
MVTEYGMSERLGARKFGSGDGEPFLGRDRSHSRDYSEEIASAIDDEVRRLIESAHDEAWEVLVQYRDVLDALVLQLLEQETLSRTQVLEIFAPVHIRPTRGSYTGYGKRLPSDRPPVLTPKELALTAASDIKDLPSLGNGQAPNNAGLPPAPPPAAGFSNPSPLGGASPLGGGTPLGDANPSGGGSDQGQGDSEEH